MYAAGLAKVDITCFEPGTAMLGWGHHQNVIEGVRTPLFARALVLRRGDQQIALLSADLCFISIALRHSTLERLRSAGFGPHQVLLSATHTHSGPSGFSHFLAFNAANFGYSKSTFDFLVSRFVDVILEAERRLAPARLRTAQARIPLKEPVAFNRSVAAYNANRDTAPVDQTEPERATDRESLVLRVDHADGRPMGAVNWFGVHASNIHADNRLLDSDNKGRAAALFEASMPGRDFVALFLQGACGDVSPNYRFDRRRRITVGPSDDDVESAVFNAEAQVRWAMRAYDQAGKSAPIDGEIGGIVEHLDFAKLKAAGGSTEAAVFGLGMAAGTDEGPGPLRPIAPAMRRVARLLGRDPKIPWISVSRGAQGRFLGLIPNRLGFRLVAPVEPMIAFVKAADDAGFVAGVPWVPNVLPVQIVRIGSVAIVGVPFEPTTVAGRRLKEAIAEVAPLVVVTPYSNGYAGYLTTEEEYRLQHYEGSATYFGAHSLAALARSLSWLARAKVPPPRARVLGPRLQLVSEDYLIGQRKVGDQIRRRFLDPMPRPRDSGGRDA